MLLVLAGDFFFQLTQLLREQLILQLELGDLFLCLEQVFGEKLAVRSNSFVKVLLLFETAFRFDVLFLESGDKVVLKLNLLKTLVVVLVGFGRLHTVLVTVRFEHPHILLQFFELVLKAEQLHLKLHLLVLQRLVLTLRFLLSKLGLHILFVKNLLLSNFILDLLLLISETHPLSLCNFFLHLKVLVQVLLAHFGVLELSLHRVGFLS